MAETANIAKIAEKLSAELFKEFFWSPIGPRNQNWECEEQARHGTTKHPTDVVFYFDEPYSKARTYVNCDLKSYAKGTIKAQAIHSAIESLSRAINCAEKSESWRKFYIHDHVSPEICGLLFVYNHDGGFDKDFSYFLRSFKTEKLDLPSGSKIVVLGPEDILWLDNVRLEITMLRGKGTLPLAPKCRFFYPHLTRRPNVQLKEARAATLEMLTAPWIILEYEVPNTERKLGYLVFYRRQGEETSEFLYLIDYLKHYQILRENVSITIKTYETAANAHSSFDKAVQQYVDECGGPETDLAKLLIAIRYEKMTQMTSVFSDIELGME